MIQAGTISTGSGCTVSVCGAYWISSNRSLRNTTCPGVAAMVSPTAKASDRGSGATSKARAISVLMLRAPSIRFRPPVATVVSMISGLVTGEFDGDSMFNPPWAMNRTRLPLCLRIPRRSSVAASSVFWAARKVCFQMLKGQRPHPS